MSKDKSRYEDFDDEMEFEDDESTRIDWSGIFHKLYARKKLFIISFILTVAIGYPLLRTMPKFYAVEVKLAPEFSSMNNSSSSLSGLTSLMKSFGIGSSTNTSGDAILPNLYPDLMNSTSFLVSLFDVPVETKDGKIKTTYYKYLSENQKAPIWTEAIGGFFGWINSLTPADEDPMPKKQSSVNAGALTKHQASVVKAISSKVVCDVDKKTGVITIDVKDQDPVVCATIADSTCQRLQEYITEYRTKKALIELNNAEKQYTQSKAAYEAAKQKYEAFDDSNWDLVDQDLVVEKQALQNDMQLQFSNMTAFNNQMLSARSKYESLRPVFTVLDGVSVPLKPAGPSRSKYLIVLLVLILGIEAAVVLIKDKISNKATS